METNVTTPFRIDAHLVTRRAKRNMVDIHSEKLIKAWLDVNIFTEKLEELKQEYNDLKQEIRDRVDAYVANRQKNPNEVQMPEQELQKGVTLKIGIDSVENSLKQAKNEYDVYSQVIEDIRNIPTSIF